VKASKEEFVRIQGNYDANSVTFYENIRRLKLDIETIAPIHGRVVPMADFVSFIGEAR